MTASDLLAAIMHNSSSPTSLTRSFGAKWHEPMRALVDLEIVRVDYRADQNGEPLSVRGFVVRTAFAMARRGQPVRSPVLRACA